MKMDYTLSGFRELEERGKQIANEDVTRIGKSAVRAGAKVIQQEAQQKAPSSNVAEGAVRNRRNKSGTTRREIHYKIKNWLRVKVMKAPEGEVRAIVHVVKAYHAIYVEFGSIHNAPNPFLSNAVIDAGQSAIDAMAKIFERGLKRKGV